jgi:signal transduction histidine kinase
VPVDIVTVGDRTVDDKTRALIAAASEAMVNAAKHSGADKVSLFQEANEQGVEVFVTDQGKGFDPASISSDRRGIVDSIVSRMEKVGGLAEIDSEPGEGTEIMLRLPS